MTIYRDQLIVGGIFGTVGGDNMGTTVAWDGSQWAPLGSGTRGVVWALAPFEGKLVAGGGFRGIAVWDGVSWASLEGISGGVHSLVEYDGKLVAAGTLLHDEGAVNHIAQWDGDSWLPLGEGLNGDVWALTTYRGDLIAGGYFTEAGGAPAAYVAQWNGSTWSRLGLGVNDYVRCLAVWGERLVVGGRFTGAGGEPASKIAQWNGSSWSTLGQGFDDDVRTLAPYRGGLVAGGDFAHSGSRPVSRIALWRRSSWTALGSGLNHMVFALAAYGGGPPQRSHLYVGGRFTTAGRNPSPYIARWATPLAETALDLSAPRPNPLHNDDQARFEFALPGPTAVHLAIYDVTGRQVAARRPAVYSSGGVYSIDWDPGLRSSGVYYVRLTTEGGQSVSTRWVVLR